MTTSFAEAVREEARYHAQIDRLRARARGRRLEALVQDGVRFAQIVEDRERVAALLAATVADGSYRPSPVTLGAALIGGKPRELARIGALDLVVHGVVAEVLAERIEPRLSERVYSYRRGRSSWQAARWLASQARVHRAARPDPRTRGLYVLRSDILAYTDSIPLGDEAPLWSELFSALGVEPASPHARMLRALLTPPITSKDGSSAPRDTGLVFGAPTTNVIANLYCMPLDAAMTALGEVYARFGDDVLFAHEDETRVREARAALEQTLAARGLRVNPNKLRVFFWNGAARPSPVWSEAKGVSEVLFLGTAVRFDGTIRLPPARWTAMLHAIRARLVRTARLAADEPPEVRARLLAKVATEALDPRASVALPHAVPMLDLVDDRTQLAELDYLLARWIAEESSRRRGPRAFREIGWRWLRREGGLASRVGARNRAR